MARKALLALLLAPAALLGDEVRLKGGGAIQGEIVEESPEEIVVNSAYGVMRVARSRVASVVRSAYRPPPPPPAPEAPEPPASSVPRPKGNQGTPPPAEDTGGLVSRVNTALASFGSFDFSEDAEDAARSLISLGAPVVPSILSVLKDASPTQQKWLVDVLSAIRDPSCVGALLDLAHSPKGEVRGAVASALGVLNDARGTQPLINLLRDADWSVRQASARSLSRMKAPEAVPALIALLSDSSLFVRGAAHDALTTITGEKLPARPEEWQEWLLQHPIGRKENLDLNGRPINTRPSPKEGETP